MPFHFVMTLSSQTRNSSQQLSFFLLLSTVHRPPSTVHSPLSTVHRPPSTVHRSLSTVHFPRRYGHHFATLYLLAGLALPEGRADTTWDLQSSKLLWFPISDGEDDNEHSAFHSTPTAFFSLCLSFGHQCVNL